MLDYLLKFEAASKSFDTAVLVGAGISCVVVGIIIWLAGTRFTRIIAAAIGLIFGSMGGIWLFSANKIPSAIVGAVAGAILAILIQRFLVVIVGLAVFAIAGIFFAIGSNFGPHSPDANTAPAANAVKLGVLKTLEQAGSIAAQIFDLLIVLSAKLPLMTLPFIAAAIVVLILATIFFRRLLVAMACASIGTAMIFVAMIMLLLFKGAAPLSYIYLRSSFFFWVFAAMIIVGTVVQMILCRPHKLKILKEEEEIKNKKSNQGTKKWTAQQS